MPRKKTMKSWLLDHKKVKPRCRREVISDQRNCLEVKPGIRAIPWCAEDHVVWRRPRQVLDDPTLGKRITAGSPLPFTDSVCVFLSLEMKS